MASSTTGGLSGRGMAAYAVPVLLSMLALAVIAVVAMAILSQGGPLPAPDVSSSSSASVSTASSAPTPTIASPTPAATDTPAPSPTPTAEWRTLAWSDPVIPAMTIDLADVVARGDGYVAVGRVWVEPQRSEAAFFISPDGLRWTVTYRVDAGTDRSPLHLVVLGDDLLAFSHRASSATADTAGTADTAPLIWRSRDGRGWTLLDSPTWRASWAAAELFDVAAGPTGVVAVGNAIPSVGVDVVVLPVAYFSADGETWRRVDVPFGEASIATDVLGMPDGYAVLGGAVAGPQSAGLPEAWYSADGIAWTAADVQAATATDGQFPAGFAFVGRDGIVARSSGQGGTDPSAIGVLWASSDGRSWQRFAADPISAGGVIGSDGSHIVLLATDPSWVPVSGVPFPGLTTAWISTDGVAWTELEVTGAMPEISGQGMWIVPSGVIYAGAEAFWFASASD